MKDPYLDRLMKEAVEKYETPHTGVVIKDIYNMMAMIEAYAARNPEFKKDLQKFVHNIMSGEEEKS